MKHTQHKSILSCHCASSISHMYGNVTALARDYLISLFPKNYIKSVYVDTMDLSEELEDDDVIRKEKPILSIKPEFNIEMDATSVGRLPDWQYRNYFLFQNTSVSYVPIFGDVENNLYIYSIPQRQKISFDLSITLNTKMKALNTAVYLRERVLHKGYFYLNRVNLETEIPKNIIINLAKARNIDLNTDEGNIELMDYLNTHSNNKIVRKKHLSSGIYQYCYCFNVNVLTMFPETPQVDDGESDGQIDKDFKVTSRLEFEFTCPFNYIFESGENFTISELDDDELACLLDDKIVVTPTISKPPIQKEDKKEMKLILWEGYIVENNIVDILELAPVMRESVKEVVKYCKDNNKEELINELFNVELYKDNYKLPEESYKFNWDTYELMNIKADIDATYFVGIYMDVKQTNDILDKINRRDLYITDEVKKVK